MAEKKFQVKINSSIDFVFFQMRGLPGDEGLFQKNLFFYEIFEKITYMAYLNGFSAHLRICHDFGTLESRIPEVPWNWLILTDVNI